MRESRQAERNLEVNALQIVGCHQPVLQAHHRDFGTHLYLRAAAAGLRAVKVIDPHGPGKQRRSGRQAKTLKDFANGLGRVNGIAKKY
jgi:hypothetical protein